MTGASRGIGKACAVALASAGYDVAVTARTMHEGEAREHSSTVAKSDTRPLPGSLATTAADIEAAAVPGSSTWSYDLQLTVPAAQAPGTYSSTITYTLLPAL